MPSTRQSLRRSSFSVYRSAFTLFELLIAIAVIGLILASVIPFIMAKQEAARRIQCAQNLGLIRNAMNLYASANHGYPRVRYSPTTQPEGWTAFTGADDANPFATNSTVAPNDVTAALWLLVREGFISDTSVFVCPSSSDWADRMTDAMGAKTSAKQRGNFRAAHHLSYSVFCMYGSALGPDDRTVWNDTLPSGCVLMADQSPGVGGNADVTRVPATAPAEAYAASNSANHGHAGQNVLRADGSVLFEITPYVGIGYKPSVKDEKTSEWSAAQPGDNIYTALRAKPIPAGQTPANYDPGVVGKTVSPAWQYDSYLVPPAE